MLLLIMCWYCGNPVKDPEPLGRSLKCEDCGKDLRSCKNCRHNLPSGCAETSAGSGSERPSDLDRANFCDWFSLNPKFRQSSIGEKNAQTAAASAKTAFNDLFK